MLLDVGYYGPLKRIWRDILLTYEIKNPRDQTLNKISFPPLLNKLIERLNLTNKTTIESAFRGTSMIPLNPNVNKVLKRLRAHRTEQHISKNVSGALLSVLKETRSPSSSSNPSRCRKKDLKIIPGKSVAYEDLLSDEDEEAGNERPDRPEREVEESEINENLKD